MIIHVRGFGKIESADIDMSNLVIFVGENNSGKTYLMQLIYGLFSFLYNYNFNEFAGSLNSLQQNDSILKIDPENTAFYSELQNKLNDIIDSHKQEIIENTFHTRSLSIDSLSVEFEPLENDYSIKFVEMTSDNQKKYALSVNDHIITHISFKEKMSDKDIEFIKKRELLSIILMELTSVNLIGNRKSSNFPIVYLPASRSGIMLLYANYLSNDSKQLEPDDGIIIENTDTELENEYGLTEPVYNFLMFLLKYKFSEMNSEANKDIISFIDTNILNGRLEKTGNTMRYVPATANSSIPIFLSSSLVSEIAPIYQVLTGIQRFGYILYDEIETCQHPTKQLQIARLLIRMVNSGYRMIVSTHSDTMAAAINNVVSLSYKKNRDSLANKLGYDEADYLKSAAVKAYQFIIEDGKTKVTEIESHFPLGIGFDFDLFNKANDKIYQDAAALAEVD